MSSTVDNAPHLVQADSSKPYTNKWQSTFSNTIVAYKQELAKAAVLVDVSKYEFSKDDYPPHLQVVPPEDFKGPAQIFDNSSLGATFSMFAPTIPSPVLAWAPNYEKDKTIAAIQDLSRARNPAVPNMFSNPHIGDRDDWYTDAVFAQQQFTGTNPTTLKLATHEWVESFTHAAKKQGYGLALELHALSKAHALYIQDYSYFRTALKTAPDADLKSEAGDRFCPASVALFHLTTEGKLHPIAIVLDYKGSIDASVTIFNRRTHPTDTSVDEKSDWPWRYAKTCVQAADWTRHEITIHLVNTHLIEEAVIVAAHRTLPSTHIVFTLLDPHWTTTLAVNAAARNTLVPKVIASLVGFTSSQLFLFMNHAFKTFDWTGLYVPTDLRKRGFPVDDLDEPKYHNYAYARNIIRMWEVLRKFVGSVIREHIKHDKDVAADPHIAAFCAEMCSPTGAQISSFPKVKTLNELIDMVTMCIHIASPQHTAVNYLQAYYQVFIPNKPGALFTPLPKTLQELQQYKEDNLVVSLPVRNQREWLLMAQIPHLLSFKVDEQQTIIDYAEDSEKHSDKAIAKAASVLKADLQKLQGVVEKYSQALDDQKTQYKVMDPTVTAKSIII